MSTRLGEMSALPRLISAVGGLLLVIAVAQTLFTLRSGGSLLKSVLDFVFIGLPGISLLLTGFWMPESEIQRRYYPRIIAWLLGGVVVMYGFIVLRDLHPGVTVEWSLGTQAIALTIGSIGGLLIGIQETEALIRRKQLEERTRELRRRERELERQNDQLEKFAGIVSHDLRNPLNVAQGRLEMIREECESEHIAPIEKAHDRMATLIEDLLTLARQGERVEATEPVKLQALVEQCWQTVVTSDATLEVDVDQSILADTERLRQLLENLFRNAIEHGGETVTVTVGTLKDGDGFYVADDGPGIPPDERGDVFESGYSTEREGTGFGLAIVNEIARAHGWEIRVTESEAGGARFEITDVEFPR